MAPAATDEKAGATVVQTTQITTEKPNATSPGTLDVAANQVPRRPSEVSTPSTGHELNPFETDIEAMVSSRTTEDRCGGTTELCPKGQTDCQAWPGQEHWTRKAKAAKLKQRSCRPLAKLSKRNQFIVKVSIILLVIGIAIGVGVGISKSLGTGIWYHAN